MRSGEQPHAVGLGIDPAGEVLGADEGDAAAAHHQLARIGAAHADHQIAVGGPVDTEHLVSPARRFLHELDQVGGSEQRGEVAPIGAERRPHDIFRLRAVGIQHVVVPVRVENRPVGVAVPLVGGRRIGGIEHGEEIREKIDQHAP